MAIQSTSFRVKEADGQFSEPIEFRVKDSNVVITYGTDDSGTLGIKLNRLDESLRDHEDRIIDIETETIPAINAKIDDIQKNIGVLPVDEFNLVTMISSDRDRLTELENVVNSEDKGIEALNSNVGVLNDIAREISTQIGDYISPILLNLEVQNGATIYNFAFGENAVGKEYIVVFDNNTTTASVILEDSVYMLAAGDVVISTAVGSSDSVITIGDTDIHTLTLSVDATEDSIYNRLANIESLLSSLNVRLGALENM